MSANTAQQTFRLSACRQSLPTSAFGLRDDVRLRPIADRIVCGQSVTLECGDNHFPKDGGGRIVFGDGRRLPYPTMSLATTAVDYCAGPDRWNEDLPTPFEEWTANRPADHRQER